MDMKNCKHEDKYLHDWIIYQEKSHHQQVYVNHYVSIM